MLLNDNIDMNKTQQIIFMRFLHLQIMHIDILSRPPKLVTKSSRLFSHPEDMNLLDASQKT